MRGNCLLLHSTCAEQAKQIMLALVDLVGSIAVVNKKNFLLIIFKHKRSCFLVFQTPTLCSVGISYLYFLHSNANITSKLLSISCDLEAMNQLVKYSLIRAFRLLKQIFQSLDRLLQEKNVSILNSSFNLNYFFCSVIVRVIECPLQIYFCVFFLSLTGKNMILETTPFRFQ